MGVNAINIRCEASSPRRQAQATAAPSVAVVVTCHAPYLPYLAECIESIEAQTLKPTEKVFVYDTGADAVLDITYISEHGWTELHVQAGEPNKPRNLGLDHCSADWVVFVDADDVLQPHYLEDLMRSAAIEAEGVGILYPLVDRHPYPPERGHSCPQEPWTYWRQRERFMIQTSAAWRRQAVQEAGGWDEQSPMYDDGNLAARITALGWRARQVDTRMILRKHDGQHRCLNRKHEDKVAAMWRFRSVGIVMLLSGREWRPTMDWLCEEEMPPHTALYVVADRDVAAPIALPLNVAKYTRLLPGQSYQRATDRPRTNLERHETVAALYNCVLPCVSEDLVLTLEDDVVPPEGGLRKLVSHFARPGRIAAAAGLYESASSPGYWCGSLEVDQWQALLIGEVDRIRDTGQAGFVPGGFTLWSNAALRKALPMYATGQRGRISHGWDANLSARLRAMGYTLYWDADCRCEHLF